MFGNAFPWLKKISDWDKRRMIVRYAVSKCSNPINLEIGRTSVPFGTLWHFEIRDDGRRGYDAAIAIEKWVNSLPRLGLLSPPRFWNRLMAYRHPTDVFLCDYLNTSEFFDWLEANCKPGDYQLYSKFEEDVSIGFRDPEKATLFKLTFGDSNI